MKKICFIINPISGTKSKKNIPHIIDTTLDKTKFSYEIFISRHAGEITEIAEEKRKEGVDIIVAVGGDGTVNEVGRAIVHSNTALGIIPCGSGNGLARHLLLPMNVKKSIGIINECRIKQVDYGLVNDNPFFCTCGLGFDAYIAKQFKDAGRRGMITYVREIIQAGFTFRPEKVKTESEKETGETDIFLLTVANASQYGNNGWIAPSASTSDGLLDVVIMKPFKLTKAPVIAYDLLNKTIKLNPLVSTYRCRHIHIQREKPGVIHFDGDVGMSDEDIDISIQDKGLNVIINPFTSADVRMPTQRQKAMHRIIGTVFGCR